MSTIAWDGKLLVTDGRLIYRLDGRLGKRDQEQRIYPCYLRNVSFRNNRILAAAGNGDLIIIELVIALLLNGTDIEDKSAFGDKDQISSNIKSHLGKINGTNNRMVNTNIVLIGEDKYNYLLDLEHVHGSTLSIRVQQIDQSELILFSEVRDKLWKTFQDDRSALGAVQGAMLRSPGTGGSVIIFDPQGPYSDKTRMYGPNSKIAFFNNIQWLFLKLRDKLGLLTV